MANYYGNTRTNYFHVKDEAAFREFMGKVVGDEDGIDLWDDEKDDQGKTLFGFGLYGCIAGIPVPVTNEDETKTEDTDTVSVSTTDEEDTDDEDESEDTENDYDAFVTGLQQHVADDDAILIFESGHEKLRYVGGGATVITAKEVRYIDLLDTACKTAAGMLQNDQWSTKCTC